MSAGPYSIGGTPWPGLSKLIEEMGELGQVCGKLIATSGESEHWDGTDLRVRFMEEAGDVLAAVRFVLDMNYPLVDRYAVDGRAWEKHRLFVEWDVNQRLLAKGGTDGAE